MSHTTREVRVCVFPLPGPAMMATVAASEHTALRCAWFNFRVSRSEEVFGDAAAVMAITNNTTSRAPDSNESDRKIRVKMMDNEKKIEHSSMTRAGPRCVRFRVASNRMPLYVKTGTRRVSGSWQLGRRVHRLHAAPARSPASCGHRRDRPPLLTVGRISRKHTARTNYPLDQLHDVSAKQAQSHHIRPPQGAETTGSCSMRPFGKSGSLLRGTNPVDYHASSHPPAHRLQCALLVVEC